MDCNIGKLVKQHKWISTNSYVNLPIAAQYMSRGKSKTNLSDFEQRSR